MTPLVSVLIPAYNAQRWLANTIRSVLAQTYPNIEIVIVDDGSTDRALSIAQSFECDRVRVIDQRNAGAAAARNRALGVSRGEWIQWLDADDLLSPDKITRQMATRADDRTLLSCRWGSFLHDPRYATFGPNPLCASLTPVEYLRAKLSTGAHMQPATWLVSRALTALAGPWEERLTLDDDGEYFARVVRRSRGITFVPDATVYYRHTGDSLSTITPKKLHSLHASMCLQIGELLALDAGPDSYAACAAYLHAWGPLFRREPALLASLQAIAAEFETAIDPDAAWRPKYRWLRRVLGDTLSLRAQDLFPRLRWSVARQADFVRYQLSKARS